MYVVLGNVAPHQETDDGFAKIPVRSKDKGNETYVHFPPGTPLAEAFISLTAAERGIWAMHSSEPPAWVQADDPAFQALLESHFDCPAYSDSKHGGKFRSHGE